MPLSNSVTVALKANVADFQRGLRKAASETKGLRSTLAGTAKTVGRVGMALGALAMGSVVASVKAFANFDAKMTESLAIMGDVSEGLRQQMADTARTIGTTTKFSADQAAEAYFFLASAGLDAKASMAALPQVAKFAQAGNFDLARATDLLTDAQSALGLSFKDPQRNMEEMAHLSDVLVKANTLANTSVQQVSEALTNKLAGALRAANIPMEEGVAVLAKFADMGLKGAAAGEAYQMVLRDLKRAATENADAFEQAGIAVFDSNGNFRNMADIIDDLSAAYGGLSVEQQTYLTNQLGFQQRSFKNIQMLLGTGDAIRTYQAALEQAGGITEEVAEKQMLTLNEQFGLLKSRVTDIGIGLGKDLAPTIQDELLPSLEGMVDSLGDFAENVGPAVVKVVKGMVEGVEALGWAGNKLAGLWSANARESAALTLVLKKMREGMFQDEDAALNMANALAAVAAQGPVTADSIRRIAEETGATAAEQQRALETMIEYAKQQQEAAKEGTFLGDVLSSMPFFQAVAGLVDYQGQLDSTTDSITSMEVELALLRNSAENTNNTVVDGTVVMDGWMAGMLSATRATENQAAAQDEANVTINEGVDEVLNLSDALAKAEENQRGLANAMLELTDPAFKAASAVQRMYDAQERLASVQEETPDDLKAIAQAQLDLAKATLEAQGALDDFARGDINDQLQVIADTLGITKQEASELLETLGLLDGTQVRTVVQYDVQVTGDTPPQGITYSASSVQFRAAGGPLAASQPVVVGEQGPEIFVPNVSGAIIPNHKLGGRTVNNVVNVTVEGGGSQIDPAAIANRISDALRDLDRSLA